MKDPGDSDDGKNGPGIPGTGIVEFDHRAYNQDDRLVAECRRQAFIRMRPK